MFLPICTEDSAILIPMKERGIMTGCTNYTGLGLIDMYGHLLDWVTITEKTIRELKGCNSEVEENKDLYPESNDILQFNAVNIEMLARYKNDFNRLIKGFETGITKNHLLIIDQLLVSVREDIKEPCFEFQMQFLERVLHHEETRPVLNKICYLPKQLYFDYQDLKNFRYRLETFIGEEMKKRRISRGDFYRKKILEVIAQLPHDAPYTVVLEALDRYDEYDLRNDELFFNWKHDKRVKRLEHWIDVSRDGRLANNFGRRLNTMRKKLGML